LLAYWPDGLLFHVWQGFAKVWVWKQVFVYEIMWSEKRLILKKSMFCLIMPPAPARA
jgi:hypothetical protein